MIRTHVLLVVFSPHIDNRTLRRAFHLATPFTAHLNSLHSARLEAECYCTAYESRRHSSSSSLVDEFKLLSKPIQWKEIRLFNPSLSLALSSPPTSAVCHRRACEVSLSFILASMRQLEEQWPLLILVLSWIIKLTSGGILERLLPTQSSYDFAHKAR